MKPEIKVELHIIGDQISSDEITDILGITPSYSMVKGESIQGTKLKVKKNTWGWSVKVKEESIDLMDYLSPFFEVFSPKAEILSSLSMDKGLYCEVACTIYIYDETPIVYLKSEVISELAKMNVHLDIDIILIAP